jgi:acetylornithine deacetylase/succinyl-diaminopimelate desuccinylase-like protein
MKNGVAMMLAALLRVKAEGLQPAGDIILVVMADEEAASDYGARFLVEEHPEQFAGVRYAIGEGGGASQNLMGKRIYPIMVAEKQVCWMKATLRGPGGHGSMPLRGGAMAALGRLLSTLDSHRLPVHITPVMRQMVTARACALPAHSMRYSTTPSTPPSCTAAIRPTSSPAPSKWSWTAASCPAIRPTTCRPRSRRFWARTWN